MDLWPRSHHVSVGVIAARSPIGSGWEAPQPSRVYRGDRCVEPDGKRPGGLQLSGTQTAPSRAETDRNPLDEPEPGTLRTGVKERSYRSEMSVDQTGRIHFWHRVADLLR